MVKQSIYDLYYQSWYNELAQSGKLDTLKDTNKIFTFEKNVFHVLVLMLIGFRCSAYNLMIEEGRMNRL